MWLGRWFGLVIAPLLAVAETCEPCSCSANATGIHQIYRAANFGLEGRPLHAVTSKMSDQKYETMYGIFLMPLAHKHPPPKVLEIGLGCNMHYGPGASAKLWRKVLPNAELWEVDVDAQCINKHHDSLARLRITALTGDQKDTGAMERWLTAARGSYDVVIDDGEHANGAILSTFNVLWPKLTAGGLYFIEDLQVGRYPRWEDTHGTAIMSDVIQAWIEQKLLPLSPEDPTERKQKPNYRQNLSIAESKRALQMRQRHPLPPNVSFIFCQESACVVGKEAFQRPTK